VGNFIIMAWMLSLGFMPNSSVETKGGSIKASSCMIQTLGMGFYLADCVYIYSTVEIQETKTQGIYFDPFRADFLIGGSVYYKNFSIGLSHECNHDIVTNLNFHEYNGWEAGFNKAYINYTMPLRISSGITITPSITMGDQFTENVRIKSSNTEEYFNIGRMYVSPNILFAEFRFEMEVSYLRAHLGFQTGYTTPDTEWAYTQFNLGTELFY
jgi:spore coat protein U-like protein